jgi:hypothetical protein
MIHPTVFSDDAAVARIGLGLFDRSLPKAEWTHAGHVAAAVWVVAARPDLVPARDVPPAIRAYNEATGGRNTDTEGYHETITQASLAAVAWVVARHPGEGLAALCNALLAGEMGRSDWLLGYWSSGVLFSVRARRAWVAPDVRRGWWEEMGCPAVQAHV